MNILFVITKSDMGGAQVFVLNLAREFKRLGHNVEVVAGDGNFLFSELEKIGVKYYYFNSLKRNFNMFNAVYFLSELNRLLKKNNYDVMHLNSTNTLIGALSAFGLSPKPKTVFTFHGLSFIDSNYNSNPFVKFLSVFYYTLFLKLVDKIVFECHINLNEVKKMKMIESGKIIYNGLDESHLHYMPREESRKQLSEITGIDLSGAFLIGSTGRLTYQKNFEFLIRVFPKIKTAIPDAKVLIIGEGPDREIYESEIRRVEIEKDFLLAGELKDSHKYMHGFDVFTMTSRYEGVSISLIEALFSGVPMLVSDVGGNGEVVGGDGNQLFKLGDENEYLNKLLALKDISRSIADHNYAMRRQFSLSSMVANYLALFNGR